MDLEQEIQEYGRRLLENAAGAASGSWMDELISRSMADADFRIQALRFIDVLPALGNDTELTEHLQEYFGNLELPLPGLAKWGLAHSTEPWATHIAAPLVRYTLRGLSRKFMGGSSLEQAFHSLSLLREKQMNASLDLLGEAVVSENEAQQYQQAYIDMINQLAPRVKQWPHHTRLDQPDDAINNRLNTSLKVSSLYSQINPLDPDGSAQIIKQRLRPILQAAKDNHSFVSLDMEQYDFRHIVIKVFKEILLEAEFRHWTDAGIAVQAYLRDSDAMLADLIHWADARNTPVTVRLVRGAYWDYETVIAWQNHWPCPVWTQKNNTDASYEQCLDRLFRAHPVVVTAVASHNPRSLAYAMALADNYRLTQQDYEFQMLFGMADHLKQSLVSMEQKLRVYIPYGKTLPGMAYLVRRLLENTSGQSIIDMGLAPVGSAKARQYTYDRPEFSREKKPDESTAFQNLSPLRFTEALEREAFQRAIDSTRVMLGQTYPLLIDAKPVTTGTLLTSVNPAQPDQVIGRVAMAGQEQADRAIAAAATAYEDWRRRPVENRSALLKRAADLLQQQRMEFAAWEILEAGKNWREADADVCEAVDFMRYYAARAEQLQHGHTLSVAGEHNQLSYRARGISVVIPPWNFPLAILTGMLSATVVTGNTAILKPSSLTAVIAARFVQLLQAAGFPDGVINYLPGSGAEVGDYLARHPQVHTIAFTGSLAVGRRLLEIGATACEGQRHIKRVSAEMGGKNALIIDADADLDEAVTGTIRSAFGFQGQKCSACSRVIVLASIHDAFVERLSDAIRSLTIGDPCQPGNFMGPVIDEVSQQRILQTIEDSRKCASLRLHEPSHLPEKGYYVAPTLFTEVDPDSALAQEEIFGPVLAVIKAGDFGQAIALANNSKYALTAGVYSRNPRHLQQARQNLQAGNIYLNRPITGAMVARQPFGGFRLSGTGSKAGGGDYLLQFVDTVCVTENTLRRGFAPEPGIADS